MEFQPIHIITISITIGLGVGLLVFAQLHNWLRNRRLCIVMAGAITALSAVAYPPIGQLPYLLLAAISMAAGLVFARLLPRLTSPPAPRNDELEPEIKFEEITQCEPS